MQIENWMNPVLFTGKSYNSRKNETISYKMIYYYEKVKRKSGIKWKGNRYIWLYINKIKMNVKQKSIQGYNSGLAGNSGIITRGGLGFKPHPKILKLSWKYV